MNVNRKFDRFKQWAGERMGGEVKTNLSDDFKALETEMNVRHDGVDRIHKATAAYIKSISKRSEGDDREKTLPIAHLGSSMVGHGEDFDANSEYGRSMIMLGRAEERLARLQDAYISQVNAGLLESLEHSLTQLKDYQTARKKLDGRRLAYDTSLSKMEKAKREDFRVEEELRTQKVKYEEANDDVCRRMQDIKDSEAEGVINLEAFLDAQLSYHAKCQEVLLQLKSEWPGRQPLSQTPNGRRPGRPRSNTAHSFADRYEPLHEEDHNGVDVRPIIRSSRATSIEPTGREVYPPDAYSSRPVLSRTSTFEGPTQLRQDSTSSPYQWPSRSASENYIGRRNSSQTRPAGRGYADPYMDPSEDDSPRSGTSPDRSYMGRNESPGPSYGSVVTRRSSSNTLNSASLHKKAPPPPPPRAKKPAPPPPPMKRVIPIGGDA